MAKKPRMKTNDRELCYQNSRWLAELRGELNEVLFFCDGGGTRRDYASYFDRRRAWLQEQIAWLSIYIRRLDDATKEKISG